MLTAEQPTYERMPVARYTFVVRSAPQLLKGTQFASWLPGGIAK